MQLRLADFKFEQAQTLEAIQNEHAALIETFNTTRHYAHRRRADGYRTPVDVLGWLRGRRVEGKELRELFRRSEFLRTVNPYGFVSVQRFYIYAESGLSRKRVLIWIYGATRQCGSIGIGGCDAFMKLCLLSSGCESRPAKGNPPGPVASLALVPEMGLTMRRHANVRAVGMRPRNQILFRMPRVPYNIEGNNPSQRCWVSGDGYPAGCSTRARTKRMAS